MRNKPWCRLGRKTCPALLLAGIGFFLPQSRHAAAAEVTVFAAASLVNALKDTAVAYEAQSHDRITFNFAASSLLSRQIEAGAPADLFFSADESHMDDLDKKGLLVAGTRKSLLSNSLVIVVRADARLDLASPADLATARFKRIALADPKAVPAGVYAKSFLQTNNLWAAVEPKVVPTDNVRAALAAVESGNVEAGIVFKTDAAISKQVRIAYEIPRDKGPRISYPAAVLKEAPHPEAAKAFLKYLESGSSGRIFAEYGFIVLP